MPFNNCNNRLEYLSIDIKVRQVFHYIERISLSKHMITRSVYQN